MAKQFRVAVIGATGYVGSHTCVELLSRGHVVTGISRQPERLGSHPHYVPKSIDLDKATIEQLIDLFSSQDAIIKYFWL